MNKLEYLNECDRMYKACKGVLRVKQAGWKWNALKAVGGFGMNMLGMTAAQLGAGWLMDKLMGGGDQGAEQQPMYEPQQQQQFNQPYQPYQPYPIYGNGNGMMPNNQQGFNNSLQYYMDQYKKRNPGIYGNNNG